MASFVCNYYGGPLDGDFESREMAPRDGDDVYRLTGKRYAKYVWRSARFAFVFMGWR